jgi:predicted CXXCH cytochrome family protein
MMFLSVDGGEVIRGVLFVLLTVLCSPAEARHASLSVGAARHPHYTDGGDEGCLRCHSGDRMHTISQSAHKAVASCESCHGPGSFHVSRAHGGKGFPKMIHFGRGSRFSARDLQINTCLDCHAGDDTGSDPISWWGTAHDRNNIYCSSCHLLHTGYDPIKEKQQQDKTCFRCHRKQRKEHPRFEDKGIDFDSLTCWTCHDVHNTMTQEHTAELVPEENGVD